ncbi:hypothetical protein N8I77_007479 [Diaporthe amygdali]|uniref:Uncharacterized protein n=1 Tax=Phomopsis amygdali TaxID=1214568 RepID=A0AAD9SBS2_PHOAM|nr:hypothetical protein N8I77_007479 [Diaporthe amygdali]
MSSIAAKRSSPESIDDLLETHRPLFRRRKLNRPGSPPPCLRCAIKGMRCALLGSDALCQRCGRNGEEFCIQQKEDLTKPEEVEEEGRDHTVVSSRFRRSGLVVFECMVYSLDPVLVQDKRRLLAIAADMLQDGAGATYVHGTRVSLTQAKNFALPSWHRNDRPENRGNKHYSIATYRTYLGPIVAWRAAEERRLALKQKAEKARLEELKQQTCEGRD